MERSGLFAVLRYQPLGNTATKLWLGRRYGNYGNCGNCEYCGELGAAMQTGLLGAGVREHVCSVALPAAGDYSKQALVGAAL